MFQPLDQFLHRWRGRGLLGYLDQEVEVVGEDAPGEHFDPAEQGVFVKQGAELLPLAFLKHLVFVHHPGDAVIVACGFLGSGFPSR